MPSPLPLQGLMNRTIKAAFVGPRDSSFPIIRAAASFHSTPVLERKRRTHWNSRFNSYTRRTRKLDSKRTLLCDISDYAEHLFQSWRADDVRYNASPSDGTSWFRGHYCSRGTKTNGFGSSESHWSKPRPQRRGGFDICSSDDDDVETIFRSTFGGERHFYWSFGTSENFQWKRYSRHPNHKNSRDWRYGTDDEDDTFPQTELASERVALGLSASGPLKLDDVKIAYRACALRWHPDRHHGSSKIAAEEKFKHCSAAYKSLCDSFATTAS